jgi:hypothetical protein
LDAHLSDVPSRRVFGGDRKTGDYEPRRVFGFGSQKFGLGFLKRVLSRVSPLPRKPVILVLILLILLFGDGGYYMELGSGYYGGGGLNLVLR